MLGPRLYEPQRARTSSRRRLTRSRPACRARCGSQTQRSGLNGPVIAAVQIANLLVRHAEIGFSGDAEPASEEQCLAATGWGILFPNQSESERAITRANWQRSLDRLPTILEGVGLKPRPRRRVRGEGSRQSEFWAFRTVKTSNLQPRTFNVQQVHSLNVRRSKLEVESSKHSKKYSAATEGAPSRRICNPQRGLGRVTLRVNC